LDSSIASPVEMTTLFMTSVDCAVCQSKQEITQIGSTNAFGSMDLDMRPPPMQRDTLSSKFINAVPVAFVGLSWLGMKGSKLGWCPIAII